jgi:hypothetical protein
MEDSIHPSITGKSAPEFALEDHEAKFTGRAQWGL